MMLHHGCDGDQSRPFPWNGPTSTGEDIYSGVPVPVPGFGVRTLRQPFDISAPPHHHPSPAAETMASHLGFLFTETQWRELQRQAMIYKYMMASIPVPPGLLSAPPTAPPLSGGFKLRISGGTDPEPGRCRRTDGKKWRCSRDVALDHKYCERHLHRGRPRSRKPVEHQATAKKSKTSHHHSLTLPIPAPPLTSDATISSNVHHNIVVFDKSSEKATTLEPLPRGLEWMMGPSEHQQWHPHNHNLNLNNPCYTNLNCCEDKNATLCGNKNNNSTIPLPSLSLSMGGKGNNMVEDEKGWIQMGLGVRGWSKNTRGHDWTSPGGPLAEVLRPSSIAEESGTALSSPSGVLQKTMASFSDSSGNSSPTPSSSAVPLPMLWLKNQ